MERGSAYIVPNIVHEYDLVSKNRIVKTLNTSKSLQKTLSQIRYL